MSLDITVNNPETCESLEMNWLRNPYGLERWARANYIYAKKEPEPEFGLWDVINHWNYEKGGQIDRALFLKIVKQYGEVILTLNQGYFWFNEKEYNQFVQPHGHALPPQKIFVHVGIPCCVYYDLWGVEHVGMPMSYFADPCFGLSDKYRPNAHTLERYKAWYQELIDFAEMLQNPVTEFYCSN